MLTHALRDTVAVPWQPLPIVTNVAHFTRATTLTLNVLATEQVVIKTLLFIVTLLHDGNFTERIKLSACCRISSAHLRSYLTTPLIKHTDVYLLSVQATCVVPAPMELV